MNNRAQETARPPRVVVVVTTFNSATHVVACLESLESASTVDPSAAVMVVDNASDDGTPQLVRSRFPSVELVVNDRNLGFAGACNVAIDASLERGVDFVFLLNPDTRVDPNFLERALAVAELSTRIAAVQSLILLAPDGERIDTAGNALHLLGFGFCQGHGQLRAEAPAAPREIAFASGAAVLLRLSALREIGLLDQRLFLYCEDLDLGWRLRRAGYSIVLAPESVVLHAHEFARNPQKYFLLERNRWLVLVRNWSPRSLLVLALPLLATELALLIIAWREGWLGAKLRAIRALCSRRTWTDESSSGRRRLEVRRVSDRTLAESMTLRMEVGGAESVFLRRVANPLLAAIWRLLRPLL